MGKMFEDLKHGLGEIKEFMDGNRTGYAVHIPDAINVKRIRGKLGLTQSAFADAYGLSLDAVKNWETGRRVPDKSAATLLAVIDKNPRAVLRALSAARPKVRKSA
jgi:putative transcriptional regulator